MKIQATVKYLDLEGGFWGLVDDTGNKYRPLNMPEQLKADGARVNVTIRKVDEAASIHMWGEAVRIQSFETLSPA